MKTNKILAVLTILSATLFNLTSRADDITAINNGSWGDTNVVGQSNCAGIE